MKKRRRKEALNIDIKVAVNDYENMRMRECGSTRYGIQDVGYENTRL